jgi:hypothetical protein
VLGGGVAPAATAADAGGGLGYNNDGEAYSSSDETSVPRDLVSQGGWPVLMDMDGGREVHALQVRG